ncbi:MAG: DUF2007 domain-containing protein [Planctomycetes bacterium]|nr:DUF2007 domain-containing protein [Planctomycetota bacterium]
MSQDDAMHQNLVTVETFSDQFQAELARQRLEQAGIPTYLNGEATTGAFVGLGRSFSTIKLEVREEDLERARELLAKPPPGMPPDVPGVSTGPEDQDEVEPEPDPDSTEALTARAWRAAVLGMLLFPPCLHVYSLWLIARVAARPDDISPEGTLKMYAALVLDGLILVAAAFIVRAMLY